uniref:SFRICE_005515 n=1 Tax=Spodoptera frugiperda TaxID=7108 RepID=A0A2H1VVI3_SPOFR
MLLPSRQHTVAAPNVVYEQKVSVHRPVSYASHATDLSLSCIETHTTASTDPHRTDRVIGNAYMQCVPMTSYGMRTMRACGRLEDPTTRRGDRAWRAFCPTVVRWDFHLMPSPTLGEARGSLGNRELVREIIGPPVISLTERERYFTLVYCEAVVSLRSSRPIRVEATSQTGSGIRNTRGVTSALPAFWGCELGVIGPPVTSLNETQRKHCFTSVFCEAVCDS